MAVRKKSGAGAGAGAATGASAGGGGGGEGYRSCQHVAEYRARHGGGGRGFRILQRCIRAAPLRWPCLRRDPGEVFSCAACGNTGAGGRRLYACISCGVVGCWAASPSHTHARAHALAAPGHDLALDVHRMELFCCACSDQVYDPDFDRAVFFASPTPAPLDSSPPPPETKKKKKRRRRRQANVEFHPWIPSAKERLLLNRSTTALTRDPAYPLGLRGMNNLGNTCFMNSVLQALLHTPPLRNYFLSDRHNRTACQAQSPHLCLGCEMDTIYSAAFSGIRTPFSPARFLYSWWQHASNLAGYEQQDAHEFFISTIDGIHANTTMAGSSSSSLPNKSPSVGGDNCCIAHRVFSGLLRSDVTCTECGFTSTTYDPCIDLSLDLEPSFSSDMALGPGASTLLGCLDRFTRPERLGSNQKFHCQRCEVQQESVKQMSVRKLPLVLCFHIKRFEHSTSRNASRKLDRFMHFPFFLDMSPYLSSSIVASRQGGRLHFLASGDGDSSDGDSSPSPSPSPSPLGSEFELFAVVTHSGRLDSGHYTCYLRLGPRWYRCDDAWVTHVTDQSVRACQGYMLFYVQKTLSYRSATGPSSRTEDADSASASVPISNSNGNHK